MGEIAAMVCHTVILIFLTKKVGLFLAFQHLHIIPARFNGFRTATLRRVFLSIIN